MRACPGCYRMSVVFDDYFKAFRCTHMDCNYMGPSDMNAEEEGMKFDKGKPRWDLLPLDIVEEIVKVLTVGAVDYGDNNWKKVEEERYLAALLRHITAYQKGENNDPDTGLSHLAHAGCNLIFLLWKEQNK